MPALGNLDFFEPSGQGPIFLKMIFIFLIGGGTDTAQFTGGKSRLQNVGCVHGPAAGGTGADDGMDLIDEQNGILFFCNAAITSLRRCSKSPRNLVRPAGAPRSREYIRISFNRSGTSRGASSWPGPSAMAVLPTPGSPTNTGLFFRRRQSTCMVRSSSGSRPISGSSFPRAALRPDRS